MSFKIVSTKENKGVCFCVVPDQWENDGILFWPGHLNYSQRESLRRNPTSAPEVNWTQLECILKFSELKNFKDALNLEKQITECVDTDAEEMLFLNMANKKRSAAISKKSDSQLTDRNDLFDNLQNQPPSSTTYLSNDKKINIVSHHTINQPSLTNNEIILANAKVPEYKTLFVQNDGSVQMINTLQECSPSMSQQLLTGEPVIINVENEMQLIRDEITGVKNEISTVKEELSTIKEEISTMKEELKKDYNKINLNLDKIHNILSDINVLPKAVDPPLNEKDLLQAFNFPLKSCEEIQALDNEIRNNVEFKTQLITFLSKIGGTSREEDGGKVSYKVIDQIFNPSILINYTWTGVARGKNPTSKKPFQILEGILDVFFQVISLADSRHTKQKNCNIFKDGVLKYATKRSLRKRSKAGCNDKSFVPNDDPATKNEDIVPNDDPATKNEDNVHNQLVTNAGNASGNSQESDVADGEESE